MWEANRFPPSILIPAAAWIKNSSSTFQIITENRYGNQFAGAGSLSPIKHQINDSLHNSTDTITAPTIDLALFIRTNFRLRDYVILKLDVEGSEYEILDKLLTSGVYRFVDKLFIEFHPHLSPFPPEVTKEITQRTYSYFKDVDIWDSSSYSIVDRLNKI